MKITALKGINRAAFAASGFFILAILFSSTHANAAPIVAANGTLAVPSMSVGKYTNYAWRCYSRCWTNRYGRHCQRVCN